MSCDCSKQFPLTLEVSRQRTLFLNSSDQTENPLEPCAICGVRMTTRQCDSEKDYVVGCAECQLCEGCNSGRLFVGEDKHYVCNVCWKEPIQ